MSLKAPRACLLSRWRGANFYSQHYWYISKYSLQGSGKWSKLQGWLCGLLISGRQLFVISFYNSGGTEGGWVGLFGDLIWEFFMLFWVWSCIYYCHKYWYTWVCTGISFTEAKRSSFTSLDNPWLSCSPCPCLDTGSVGTGYVPTCFSLHKLHSWGVCNFHGVLKWECVPTFTLCNCPCVIFLFLINNELVISSSPPFK